LPPHKSGWTPRVLTCSAATGAGIGELRQTIEAYRAHVLANGYLTQNRHQQAAYWLKEALLDGLINAFYTNPAVKQALEKLEPRVLNNQISPFAAADAVLETLLIKVKNG
jgi:LAO/AO transport system kinase